MKSFVVDKTAWSAEKYMTTMMRFYYKSARGRPSKTEAISLDRPAASNNNKSSALKPSFFLQTIRETYSPVNVNSLCCLYCSEAQSFFFSSSLLLLPLFILSLPHIHIYRGKQPQKHIHSHPFPSFSLHNSSYTNTHTHTPNDNDKRNHNKQTNTYL